MPDGDRSSLEARLAGLASAVEFPATPNLSDMVGRRLRSGESPARGARRQLSMPRVAGVALVALLLASAIAVAASPGLREAISEIAGVRVDQVPELPPREEGAGPGVGERTTIAGAKRRAGFDLLEPAVRRPRDVYIRELGGSAAVTFAYGDQGLLLTQFRAHVDRLFFRKLVADTRVERVRVRGQPGYRLSGGEHVIQYRSRGRTVLERLAGDVLLWQRGDVTLRLEGELPARGALRLARSTR